MLLLPTPLSRSAPKDRTIETHKPIYLTCKSAGAMLTWASRQRLLILRFRNSSSAFFPRKDAACLLAVRDHRDSDVEGVMQITVFAELVPDYDLAGEALAFSTTMSCILDLVANLVETG